MRYAFERALGFDSVAKMAFLSTCTTTGVLGATFSALMDVQVTTALSKTELNTSAWATRPDTSQAYHD